MTGIDTNVLVRFITNDDPVQSKTAAQILATLTQDHPGYVSLPVTLELIWVLARLYKFPKTDIIHAVDSLARADELLFQHAPIVRSALHVADDSNLDIADVLVFMLSIEHGCDKVVTFDKGAVAAGMTLLSAN